MKNWGRSRQIAVTGYGMITSIGRDVGETWSALINGRSGCSTITRFAAEAFPVRIAAEVPRAFWRELQLGSLAYTFGEIAACEALGRAGLRTRDLGIDTALVVGVGGDDDAGEDRMFQFLDDLIAADPDREYDRLGELASGFSPPNERRVSLETLASALAIRFGVQGEVSSVATACASGAHAIALASDLLEAGAAQRALVIGTDAMVNRLSLANFCALGVLSRRNATPETACRPFDARRQGFVLGEGAGALVLERSDASTTPPLGYLTGYGVSADAHAITDKESDGNGVGRSIDQALVSAGITPDDLTYINAHGTGTRQNDIGEAAAIRLALGSNSGRVAISSIKGQIGHTIAAAGAIEAIITLLALRHGCAPGTSSLECLSPEMTGLNILGAGAHPIRPGLGLSISSGFGGVNVSLILDAAEGGTE